MERIAIVPYKGREIVSIDYRGLDDEDELFKFNDQVFAFLHSLNRPTLQMTNIEGIHFTPKLMKAVQEQTPKVQHLIMKDAVLGITGVKRILFQVYSALLNERTRSFPDEISAKEWLVRDN
jgi:hypothetical protein